MGIDRNPDFPGFRRVSLNYLQQFKFKSTEEIIKNRRTEKQAEEDREMELNNNDRIFYTRNLSNKQVEAFKNEEQQRTDIHNRNIISFINNAGSFAWAEMPGNLTAFGEYIDDEINYNQLPSDAGWNTYWFIRFHYNLLIQLCAKATKSTFPNYPSEVNKLLVDAGIDITNFDEHDKAKEELLAQLQAADKEQQRKLYTGWTDFPFVAGLTAAWLMLDLFLNMRINTHANSSVLATPVAIIDQRVSWRPITTLQHLSR